MHAGKYSLSAVNLESNVLGPSGAAAIGEALKAQLHIELNGETAWQANRTLTALNLTSNDFRREGAAVIGAALKVARRYVCEVP